MQNKFLSKSVPRGTRTIWRYLGALFLLFTFAVGNMWAADYNLINDNDDASTATLNTDDFWTQGTFSAKSNGGDLKKCIVLGGNISAGVTNINYPTRYISYGVKTTSVTITIKAYQSNNSAKKINIYEVNEAANGALTVTNTKEESVAKGLKTITFTASPAAGTRSTIYITSQAASNFEFYQVTASETGTALTNLVGGRVGYAIDYSKKSRLATKSGETAKLDGIEYYKLASDYKPNNTQKVVLKTGGYIKFNTIEPIVLTIVTTTAQKFYVAQKADGTTNPKEAADTHKIKLSAAGDWYIIGGSSSATDVSSIAFSVPTISYDKNDEGASGTMSSNTWTVAANGFTPPSGKKFDKWTKNPDGTGGDVAVDDELLENTTLYAQWKADVEEYTVIYKDGETELKRVPVEVGQTPEAYTPTKALCSFAGWKDGEGNDVTLSSLATSAAKNDVVTLYAQWTKLYAQSVDFTSYLLETERLNKSLATVIEENGLNYTCGGTFSSSEWGKTSGEDAAFQGYKFKDKNVYIEFRVEANKHVTLLFGNYGATGKIKVGDADAVDCTLTDSKYEINTDAEVIIRFTTNTGSGSTVTLKKITISSLYTASYVDETGDGEAGGNAGNVSEVTLPTPSATTVTVEQKEYTFTGWTPSTGVKVGGEDKGTSDVLTAGTVVTLLDNTTFTAQWQEVTDFDVKFFPGYGENAQIGNTQKISTNGNAEAPTNPTRAGYKFLGWSTDGTEANIVNVDEYAITTATTFTAVWKQVWTVTFDGAGNVEVENGEKVASPNSPVQAGKVFQGWYNDESKYDFSAAVTGNLALTSKWANADANHYVYAYNDDFHFDGVLYKTPEGKVDNTADDNKNIAYTLYEGAEGITSVVLTNGSYDCKTGALQAITSHLKLKNDASSKLVITIKEGYTATLKIKAAAYSGTRNYAVSDAEPAAATTAGRLVNDNAMNLSSLAEQTFALEAGTHNITANGGTLYISEMDIEAELIPTYTVTYAKGDEGASDEMTDDNSYYAGDEVTLLNNTFGAPTGMIWSAWSVKDANNNDVEVVNGKFAMPASNVTVTAVWAVDNGMARLYRSDDTEDANSPYATLVEAVAAAQNGDKIVLQRNVTDGAGIMLTTAQAKEITIDFGGFTYTAVSPGVGSTGTQNQAFHLEKGNTVTLKNGTIACSGSEIKMLIQNYCDLTLENITLNGTGLEGSHRYVMSNNCGDVVIGNGTTIIAKTGDVAFDVCATNYYPDGVTVTVKDGASITGIVEYDVWGTKPAENKAELAIEGGEFDVKWNVEAALAEDAKKNLNVSGGSFTEVVPVDYCAEGVVPVTEADPVSGKYKVTPGYKVTFVDDNEELETVGVEEGEAVAAIEIADKIGYEFDAWYTESENAWDFATVVTADMKLYAKWNVFEGCVMLKPAKTGDAISANDAIAMQEGSFGATMKALTANLSYNTNGLLFGNNSDTKAEVTLSSNTLKAGTVITAVIYNDNDSKARGLSLWTKDGASVANVTWTATVVGTHTETYTVQAGDGLEGTNAFQLKREQNAYLQSIKITNCGAEPVTVTFKSANETLIAEEVIEKGTKVVAPVAPHVSGKRFIGWSETKNDAESLVNLTTTDIDADVTYYAVYEDVVCPTEGTVFSMAITDPAGTEYEENNNFGLEIGATYVGGKAYSGSKNDTKRKGEIDTNGEYSFAATGDLTVKVVLDCALAEGDVISFTTTTTRELKIQKVAGSDLVTTSGKKYTIPAESPLIGLDEFYLERGNSESTFKTFRIDRPYTISFDMQEHGAAIAAQKLLAGEKVAEPAAPTADGYDFFGWYKEAACTNAWDFDEDLVSASATLYAKWDVHRADIATLKSLKYGDNEILVADQYEYDIELPYATTAVPALSAVATSATAHSVDITNASAFDEDGKATSKVVVTAEDEVTTQTYWVHFTKAAALEQTLVTETTVWDWTKAGDNVDKKTTAQGVMANEIGIVNNADFNSQALWYKGRYPKRNDAHFQGAEIRIETTVPGVIYVEYSNTGGNSARTVEINGVKGLKSTDAANVKVVDSIAVNAGTVVIKGIQVSDNAASDLRIFKITFNTAADHTRENLNPSNIGTLCWESNAMLIGATLYKLAGKNENGYLVFDEVSENRLEAGKGYVFVPENGNTEIKVYNTDKKMAKTEPENVEVGLQGTFEELTSAEGENSPLWDNYIITNNHFVHINSTNVGVRANRAYIRGFESIPQAGAPQQASNGAPRRRLVMEGNPAPATATDIDNIFGNDTKAEKVLINGQLFILRGGKMFDAAGQLVK